MTITAAPRVPASAGARGGTVDLEQLLAAVRAQGGDVGALERALVTMAADDGRPPACTDAAPLDHQCMREWAARGRAEGWTPGTIRQRLSTVRRVSAGAAVAPCRLTATDAMEHLDRPMSPASRATYTRDLRAWAQWLMLSGRCSTDPFALMPKARQPRGLPRPVSEAELARLLAATAGPVHLMVVLAAYEGLRIHEIAKIAGEDVTADAVYVLGKGGKRASIPTHPRLRELLPSTPRAGYWFPGRYGGHRATNYAGRLVVDAMAAAGIEGGAHRLRHRFGTAVLRASDGNLRVAQELLRHSSPTTTAIYTLVEDSEKRSAMEGLL